MHVRESADRATFEVENRCAIEIRVRLELTEAKNIAGETSPVLVVVPPGERAAILEARPRDPAEPWSTAHRWRWTAGDPGASHDDSYRYALPFDAGEPRLVVLGPGGWPVHMGADHWAFDFEMPIGTPVLAAREGTVVMAVDRHQLGGPSDWLLDRANHVTVLHSDGTLASYAHLRYRGVSVASGDQVERGQLLGESGMTGYAPEPHLHFAVWKAGPDARTQTIAIRFDDGSAEGYVAEEDMWVPPQPPEPVRYERWGPFPTAVPPGA